MTGHIRFWWWTVRTWVCDRLPGATCWIHGGILTEKFIADDDPCWERAGWKL